MCRLAAVMMFVLLAGACHPLTTPLGTAERFVRAAHGKGRSARRYLVAGASLTDKALAEQLKQANLGAAFAASTERRTAKRALGTDEPLELIVHGDRYWLSRDPLDAYPRTTAELCLRSFVRAVDAHRAELLLQFIPRRYRNTIDSDALGRASEGPLHDLAEQIRLRLDQPLEYLGPDEARLMLDDRRAIRLRRSEGAWLVESFDS